MDRNSRYQKYDVGLLAQTLNNANATGRWFSVANWRVIVAHLIAGAMAAGKAVTIEIDQAQDQNGTGAKAITNATATVTANANVDSLTMTNTSVAVNDTVTITVTDKYGKATSYVFTAAAATSNTARQFAQITSDNATAAALALCINDPVYGVPNVKAVAANNVITLTTIQPGDSVISAVTSGATVVFATVEAQAYVEIDVANLDVANGFQYIAVKVTTTGNTPVSAALLRGNLGGGRFGAFQQVGAFAEV